VLELYLFCYFFFFEPKENKLNSKMLTLKEDVMSNRTLFLDALVCLEIALEARELFKDDFL
jgi:hypothetical protein